MMMIKKNHVVAFGCLVLTSLVAIDRSKAVLEQHYFWKDHSEEKARSLRGEAETVGFPHRFVHVVRTR